MAAQELHVADVHQDGLTPLLAVYDVIPAHAETVSQLFPAGKPGDLWFKVRVLSKFP